jgi:hypothetical protein
MLGGGLAIGTGYLGGHLSFGRGVGTGVRSSAPQSSAADEVEAVLDAGGVVIVEDETEILVEGPNTR